MRLAGASLLGLCGLLSATLTLASGNTHFMDVRAEVANDYENEENIPTEKYFSEWTIVRFRRLVNPS